MLIDKILFSKLKIIGKSLMEKAGLTKNPQNVNEMYKFFTAAQKAYNSNEFDGLLFATILFNFVSSLEVRDRHTTARIFEDMFSSLFDSKASDSTRRKNPTTPESIINLNSYNSDDNWKISSDLASNKREKADVFIANYAISLKTLKGVAYDEYGKRMKYITSSDYKNVANNENKEINVGSLSFRALLKGILPDEKLKNLGDRKKGLGSKTAIRHNVLDEIKKNDKTKLFKERLSLFMNYVYEDDLYIVLKGHYKITWILIPSNSFINTILKTYEEDEPFFENIWYRWENNNLRMYWRPLLQKMKEFGFEYKIIEYNLGEAVNSTRILEFNKNIESKIEKEIEKEINKK